MILALCVIFIGFALAAAAFWFSMNWLFYENPRLIIREVQLDCESGIWAVKGKPESEQTFKAQAFAKRYGIELGKTNIFSKNLSQLREDIRRDQPEIEHISIRRELPDLLVFKIQNRMPRADAGYGYFLDDEGLALRSKYYAQDDRAGLPLVYSDTLRQELSSEGKTTDPEIGVALAFIRMIATSVDPCIQRISIRKVIVVRNSDARYLQCEILYRDDPNPYRVLMPTGVSAEQLRHCVAERLIPILNAPQNASSGRAIDLRFEGPAFVPR